MRINNLIFSVVCVAALCVGCQSPPSGGAWSKATEDMLVSEQLRKLHRCPLFVERSTLHVMAIGEIKNDTALVSDDSIESMKATIASKLANSGVVMISMVGSGRVSLPQGEKAVAPTLMLHGKLTQRDFRKEDGRRHCEFTLELSIVELATGIRIWSNKSVVAILDNGEVAHCEKIVTKSSQCI